MSAFRVLNANAKASRPELTAGRHDAIRLHRSFTHAELRKRARKSGKME